jgi:hypothetical protein
VGDVLHSLFHRHAGRRIITASFASHLHRIQQIADAAVATGRVVATLGLSMKKNVRMGRDLGIISIPDASLIDIDDIDKYPPGQVCIVSTGSQGEPMSALALLARGADGWATVPVGLVRPRAIREKGDCNLKAASRRGRPEWRRTCAVGHARVRTASLEERTEHGALVVLCRKPCRGAPTAVRQFWLRASRQ